MGTLAVAEPSGKQSETFFVCLEQIIMRLYTFTSARPAPANSRTKGSVYKERLSHAPCHVYFCLSVMFVYPPLETLFLFGSS